MTGDECFAIATDLRYGQELKTITCDFPKAFQMDSHLWMGLAGLATDVQVIKNIYFLIRKNYKIKMGRTTIAIILHTVEQTCNKKKNVNI